MDVQDIRNLQEAYLEVYQVDEELTGARKQTASDLLNRKLRDVKTLRNLSARKSQKPEDVGSGNRARRRAGKEVKDSRIAVSDSYDLYDIILSHLLDEGYAETPEAAEVMMVNMSEEWRDSICEAEIEPPRERVGALTDIQIPKSEREAARERTLAKAKAMREKKKN